MTKHFTKLSFTRPSPAAVPKFESPGMRRRFMMTQPDRLEDLRALNALYRSGPMGMIDDFADRKHGRKEVVYDLPEMKEILEETYGVMVYHWCTGDGPESHRYLFAGREADPLRRAMGKKKVERKWRCSASASSLARAAVDTEEKVEKDFST